MARSGNVEILVEMAHVIHEMCMTGRSDAAYGKQIDTGKCRLWRVFGLAPSCLDGPCYLLHWPPRFTRRAVQGSLEEGTNSCSALVDHMEMVRYFRGNFGLPTLPIVGL